ncbi:hypothetical protein SY88_12270 [Clostridiales bacterium PH28_bin88]|nr:hypothetical protein SY88_12270 [Clostridiales bacterium PH28_bin88]
MEAEALKKFCRLILEKAGMPSDDAELVSGMLVEADLRGHETHGVARLGMYMERVNNGVMQAKPQVRVVTEGPAMAVLDGDHGFGQVVAVRAMDLAIEKAGRAGVGVVGVRNSGHLGALGLIAERALSHRMIGTVITNTSPIMAPWGGVEPVLGNNPFALAVPRESGETVVVDMALSITARGNIILAARENQPILAGWALNSLGEPTTDAAEALLGTVLPMAGHKGYAMSLVADILAGVLTGASFGRDVGSLVPPDLSKPLGMGHLVLALDIGRFIPWEEFQERLEALLGQVKNGQLAKGSSGIYLPGERSAQERAKRLQAGIPLKATTREELKRLGETYGVAMDW